MMRAALRHGSGFAGLALAALACSSSEPRAPSEPGFVRARGSSLFDGRDNVTLRAVRFDHGLEGGGTSFEARHTEGDYERVRSLGFDSVHLSLGLDDFTAEGDSADFDASTFEMLDRNVEWAKTHGLRLVLSLDEPAGETPERCKETPPLWQELDDTRKRVLALLRAVAERYAAEEAIAAFQILSRPTPAQSKERYAELAQEAVAAIREVDAEHLIVVPELEAVDCDYAYDLNERFVPIADTNVAYGLAFDWPRDFTTQGLAGPGAVEAYPADRLVVDWSPSSIHSVGWTDDSDPRPEQLTVGPGDTTWTRKAFGYEVIDPACDVANVTLLSRNNSGTVCFDDVRVEKYTESGLEVVFDLDIESEHGWFLWEDGDGMGKRPWTPGTGRVSTGADGASGAASVCLENTTTDASLGHDYLFAVGTGESYLVSYAIRAENSAPSARSLVKLDFFDYQHDLEYRDRSAIARRLDAHSRYAPEGKAPAPLYLYSVGTGRPSLEHGGLEWTRDTLDLARERNISFAYRAYRGADYGLYAGGEGPVDSNSVHPMLAEVLNEQLSR